MALGGTTWEIRIIFSSGVIGIAEVFADCYFF